MIADDEIMIIITMERDRNRARWRDRVIESKKASERKKRESEERAAGKEIEKGGERERVK